MTAPLLKISFNINIISTIYYVLSTIFKGQFDLISSNLNNNLRRILLNFKWFLQKQASYYTFYFKYFLSTNIKNIFKYLISFNDLLSKYIIYRKKIYQTKKKHNRVFCNTIFNYENGKKNIMLIH